MESRNNHGDPRPTFTSLTANRKRCVIKPASQAQVQPFAFLGFALAEATGLFGLAIAFLILFVF